MNKQELEKRTQIITSLLAIYDKAGDKNMIVSYVELLKDMPVDVLQATCRKLSLESEYRPTRAVIFKAAKNLVAEANGTNTLPFADVWKEIIRQLNKTYFDWEEGEFSRKEIKQLVDSVGGLRSLRMMTMAEEPVIRAQMNKMYDSICKRNEERETNAYILGTSVLIGTDKEVRLKLK